MGNNQSHFNTNPTSVLKLPPFMSKLTQIYQKNHQNQDYTLHQTLQNQSLNTLRKYSTTTKVTPTQYDILDWRKNTNAPVIKVYYVELQKNYQKLHSGMEIQINVYSDHILKCVADMYNLKLDESIYVFRQCLLGYQAILSKLFKVSINKFYCGINVQGKIKAWINKRFCDNQCELSQKIRQSHGQMLTDQCSVISKIIHMVSMIANLQQTKYFFYGLEKQLKLRGYTFNRCHDYINNFIANSKITVPDCLQRYLAKNKTFSGVQVSRASRRPSRIQVNKRSVSKKNSLNSLNLKQNKANLMVESKSNLQKSKSRGRYTLFERKSSNLLQDSKHLKLDNDQSECNKTNCISIQNILQRSKKSSIKSNELLNQKASNIINKKQHRPSITVATVPSFLSHSRKKQSNLDDSSSNNLNSFHLSNNSNISQDKISKTFHKDDQSSQNNLRLRSASISYHLKLSNTSSLTHAENMYNCCKEHDKNITGSHKRSFLNTRTTTSQDRQNLNCSSLSNQFFVNSNGNRIRKGSDNPSKIDLDQNEAKRSLISFKYTFEQIIQGNSCKQIEEQNQVKQFIQASFKQITMPAEKSRLKMNRKQSDSQQQILKLQQKTQEVLYQNQWTKTINNLPLGRTSSKNLQQSIIEGTQQLYDCSLSQVRLQKLQKLGREVCFSVIPETE